MKRGSAFFVCKERPTPKCELFPCYAVPVAKAALRASCRLHTRRPRSLIYSVCVLRCRIPVSHLSLTEPKDVLPP